MESAQGLFAQQNLQIKSVLFANIQI